MAQWAENLPAMQKTGDMGSIPWSGRSPGEGSGNLLQYSCLVNPMDRGAWRAIVHGVKKSPTQVSDWENTHTHTHTHTLCGIFVTIDELFLTKDP